MTAPTERAADHPGHVARAVVVHGRVQGVFFRDSCRREADRAQVTGWVRNEPDGSVAAFFEGPAAAVESLVAWCRQGPSRARVDRVEVAAVAARGSTTFEVVD
jgi:acylphosphatase